MHTASSSQYVELSSSTVKNFKADFLIFFFVLPKKKCVTKSAFLFLFDQNPADGSWEDPALEKLHLFCEESRHLNDWVPEISLPER